MLDIGRAVALGWALLVAVRARAGLAGLAVLAVTYLYALEVASGITVRDHGPFAPMVVMLLIFIGPSGMPRGPLPALPLAGAGTTYAVSVTGLAGPGGGTADKPVGPVFVGLATPDRTVVRRLFWPGRRREQIRSISAMVALDLARRALAGLPLEESD